MKIQQSLVTKLKATTPDRIPFDGLARRIYAPLLDRRVDLYASLPSSREQMLALREQAHIDLMAALGPAPGRNGRPTAFNVYEDLTNGSTGKPKLVLRPAISLQCEMLRLDYLLRYYAGAVNCRPPSIVIHVSRHIGRMGFYYVDSTNIDLHIFKIPISEGDSAIELAQLLRDHKGEFVLSGTASSLDHLANKIGLVRMEPAFILCSGEDLPERVQFSIESVFRSQVFGLYVMTEFGVLGFRCLDCGSYHLMDSDLSFENAQDGRLLVTDPTNTLQPRIGYDTGDICFIEDLAGSDCVHGWPRTRGLKGRPFGKPYLPP